MVGEFIQLDTDIWEMLSVKQVNNAGNLFVGKGYAENYEFKVFARKLKEEDNCDISIVLPSKYRIFEITGRAGVGKTSTAYDIGIRFVNAGKKVLYLGKAFTPNHPPIQFERDFICSPQTIQEHEQFFRELKWGNRDLIILDEFNVPYPIRKETYEHLYKILPENTKVIVIRKNNDKEVKLSPINIGE